MTKVKEEVFKNLPSFNLYYLLIPIFTIFALLVLYIICAYLQARKKPNDVSMGPEPRSSRSHSYLNFKGIRKCLKRFFRSHQLYSLFYFILYVAISFYLGFRGYNSMQPLSYIGSILKTYYFYIPFTLTLTVFSLFAITFSIATVLVWLEFAIFILCPGFLSYYLCKDYISHNLGPLLISMVFFLLLLTAVKLLKGRLDSLGSSLIVPMNALYFRFVPIITKIIIALLIFSAPLLMLSRSFEWTSAGLFGLFIQIIYISWSLELFKCVCNAIISLETIDYMIHLDFVKSFSQKRSLTVYSAIFINLCHISFVNSFIFIFTSLLSRLTLEFVGVKNLGFLSNIVQPFCECFIGVASIFTGAYAVKAFGFDSNSLISHICFCRAFDVEEVPEDEERSFDLRTGQDTTHYGSRLSRLAQYNATYPQENPNDSYCSPSQYLLMELQDQHSIVQPSGSHSASTSSGQFEISPLSKYYKVLVCILTFFFFAILSSLTYYLFLSYAPLVPIGTVVNPASIRATLERHGFEYFVLFACTLLFYIVISSISSVVHIYQFYNDLKFNKYVQCKPKRRLYPPRELESMVQEIN